MNVEKKSLQTYLDNLQSQGQYWFLRKNAIKSLKCTDNAFRKAAYRLIKKNRLNRIRRDFYTIVPAEYRAVGCLPASWFIDALMHHLNQQYYVGLLTAAAVHGASHQQSMIFQVITDKQMRPITAGQVRIEFHYKKRIRSHFFQQTKTSSGTMNVSSPEMTTFDLLRYINASGQINNVATVLSEIVEKLDPLVLSNLLYKGDVEIATAQRLGYLLEKLDLEINLAPLEKKLMSKKPITRLLVVGSTSLVLEHNRRWHILVNEPVEPDVL